MRIRWTGGRIVAATIGLLLLSSPATDGQGLTPIVVGCTVVDDSTAVLYALQSGMFRRAGLDVRIEKTASGAAAAASVLGGSLQIANSSVMAPITAYAHGVPLQIAAPGAMNGVDFMAALVRKDSPIATGRDLNGAIVGSVSVTDLLSLSILAWMDQHGGDSRTVKTIELPYATMVPALSDGRIAVAGIIQPILGQALATGKVQVLAHTFESVAPHFLISAWLTSASYAAANPDVIRRFAAVVQEAAVYANAHHAETAPIAAAFTGVDVQTVLHSGRSQFDETPIAPRDIQPVIDVAYKYKAIDKTFDARELISPAILPGAH